MRTLIGRKSRWTQKTFARDAKGKERAMLDAKACRFSLDAAWHMKADGDLAKVVADEIGFTIRSSYLYPHGTPVEMMEQVNDHPMMTFAEIDGVMFRTMERVGREGLDAAARSQ